MARADLTRVKVFFQRGKRGFACECCELGSREAVCAAREGWEGDVGVQRHGSRVHLREVPAVLTAGCATKRARRQKCPPS